MWIMRKIEKTFIKKYFYKHGSRMLTFESALPLVLGLTKFVKILL